MAKKVTKLNLSDHTLDINIRKCNYSKFDFSEIEEYVRALTGDREYQFDAIKRLMIYLWGGSYTDISQLAKDNYKSKPAIQYRFQSEENFLRRLPLPDRLSGVVHMATGTGKSYIIFAIAYLSIILGYVKKVLVLGPSSTVIESGLWSKFREHLNGKRGIDLQQKLSAKYSNIPINLLNENEAIVDNSIVIENINSIWYKDRNAIGDTLFSKVDEVLVLSDEVHHAYTHLNYSEDHYDIEEGGKGENRDERLWMKFLREEPKIKRHIGFTGTPYNQDEYFVDVIYNYSIKDALDGKVIKKINPIIHTTSEGEETELKLEQRYEQILITHYRNIKDYSYLDSAGKPRLKPITVFINGTQSSAQSNTEEFTNALCEYLKNNEEEYKELPSSQLYQIASEKVICVISKPTDADYQSKLDAIEELDQNKDGGKVEFIFAVNKLSEGWDVDNVYQIVPMQERVFKSKLLISQVLGRGLRLPRRVPLAQIQNKYPIVTVTNHDKFAAHIKDLVAAVTNCESRFLSKMFKDNEKDRSKHNFTLFNLEYVPSQKVEKARETSEEPSSRTLVLTPPKETLKLNVEYLLDEKKFSLHHTFFTLDQIVLDVTKRFETHQFERRQFDFGDGIVLDDLPGRHDIERVIKQAMEKSGFANNKLSEQNRKQVDIFFNQYLPKGKKKVVRFNIEGNISPIDTSGMAASSTKIGELDKYTSVFVSEDYKSELSGENRFVIDELAKRQKDEKNDQLIFEYGEITKSEYYRQVVKNKGLFSVNTSMFKTPQNLVIVSHNPEMVFIFNLINHAKLIHSWIKSRDMDFYSLDYEYFKRGKDRTRRSFNPDFFIKFDLNDYLDIMHSEISDFERKKLEAMQEQGRNTIIKVVEIKSDEDRDEVTRAKEKYASDHFEALNRRLRETNPIDLPDNCRDDTRQIYTFDLLTPKNYELWFHHLKIGTLV